MDDFEWDDADFYEKSEEKELTMSHKKIPKHVKENGERSSN